MTAKDKNRKHLTQTYVRELFIYRPRLGVLVWRRGRSKGRTGVVAGVIGKRGRRVLCIDGIKYYASRVIWLYVKGEWPEHEIDHKNRDKTDDRWSNLRAATRQQNGANRSITLKNKHGFWGVKQQSFKEGRKTFRFFASIKVDRKDIYLGRRDTAVEAAHLYDAAAKKYFGEFAVLNFPLGAET